MNQEDINSTNEPDPSNSNLCDRQYLNRDRDENSANPNYSMIYYKISSENKLFPSSPKQLKNENEPNEIQIATDAQNQEQSPDIYKMPFELLTDTFNYLSLKDLCAIRQTSKLFHQIAEFCFQKKLFGNCEMSSTSRRDRVERLPPINSKSSN